VSHYLIAAPDRDLLWTGSIEVEGDHTWLLSWKGQRLWHVPNACIKPLSVDEARAFVEKERAAR
jgi:hypothetical protein